jgi:hypothetical protein
MLEYIFHELAKYSTANDLMVEPRAFLIVLTQPSLGMVLF